MYPKGRKETGDRTAKRPKRKFQGNQYSSKDNAKLEQSATAKKLASATSDVALHPDVEKHLLPIYEDLSKEDLLNRCLGGHTQNANESFNSTIWRLAPKHLNCGLKIVEITAFIAAGVFNEGYYAVLKIMETLELKIGQQCKFFADTSDAQRVTRQERRSLSSTKEARTARRLRQIEQNQFNEEEEGLLYGPGIAD